MRLVLALRTSGVPFAAVGEAIRKGRLSLDFVDDLAPDPIPLVPETNNELVERLGPDPEVALQLGRILGTCALPDDEQVRADQVEIFELYRAAQETGAPDEGLLRVVRATVESMRHIIDAQRDFADEVLIRPLVKSGMSPSEILAVSSARPRSYREMGQRLINLLFVRLADEAVFQNVVEHMEAALADKRLRIGEHTGAIAFMDVSGYTRMTEEAGDEEAVTEALRFIELVESVAAETGGRIVKVLGDGVMTHFDDADGAVRAAVLLVGRSYTAGLPAARAGINTGPMVRRDGDYFGSVVNIAARAADYARPREVLVTDAAVEAWTGGNSINFQGIGAVALKNVRKRIELYRAAPETPLE